MATIVYLSNQLVQATETKKNGTVAICEEQAPEGSIINGIVTDAEVFVEFLRQFFVKNKLSRKECTLVVNSTQITTRVIELPKAGYDDLNQMLEREFADSRIADPLIVSYVMNGERTGRLQKLLAAAVERTFAESYVKLFAQAGIEVSCIEPAMLNFARRFMNEPVITKQNCVVQIYDGSEVISILFVEGEYLYSQRNRIFAQEDTEGYVREARAVAQRIRQFASSQKVEKPVESLFVCGKNQQRIVEALNGKQDSEEDATIRVFEDTRIRLSQKSRTGQEAEFAYAVQAQKPDKKLNYIWKLHHDSAGSRKKREGLRLAAPTIITVAVCLVVTLILGNSYLSMNRELEELQGNIQKSDPESASYDLSEANVNRMKTQIRNAELLWEQLMSYPTLSSTLDEQLKQCAGEDTVVEITGFSRDTGVLTLEASSGDVSAIHAFVESLRTLPEICDVEYSGYTYMKSKGNYSIHVVCALAEGAGRTEGE